MREFNNFIIALAVFTLVVRFALLPLTLRQQRSSMKMQAMQPEIQRIQKKYRDNPQKMQEEFQKIGYNPADTLMGCLPLLIQFPIFIGLYRAIIIMLGSTPQSVYELTQQIYPWVEGLFDISSLLPISNTFLWLNLAQPDPFFVLPVLVGGTMYLSQKLMMPSTNKDDEKGKGKKKQEDSNPMAGMTQTMTVTMPLMFGFFSLTFPAGLSVYFVLANLVGIGQGFIIRRQRESIDVPTPVRRSDDADEEAEGAKQAEGRSNGQASNGSSSGKKQYQRRKKGRSKKRS